jgi:hypothetical protein
VLRAARKAFREREIHPFPALSVDTQTCQSLGIPSNGLDDAKQQFLPEERLLGATRADRIGAWC